MALQRINWTQINTEPPSGSVIILGSQTYPLERIYVNYLDISGSSTFSGGITGSLYGTASYSLNSESSSYSLNASSSLFSLTSISSSFSENSNLLDGKDSTEFAITGSNIFVGNQVISGSLAVTNGITGSLEGTSSYSINSLTASFALNVTPIDTSSLAGTGSNIFVGNQVISGSLAVTNGITGSLFGTSSWSVNSLTSSYAGNYTLTSSFNSFTSSYNTGSFTGSFRGSFSGSLSNFQNGVTNYIPYFSSSQVLGNSAMYQINNGYSVALNQIGITTAAPEALYVWQPNTTSYNVISGKGNINNYLQLNIQNTNQGTNASSDVVATADNGSETSNYIDMGINSENFIGDVGKGNDAYLYSTGRHLHIGNVSNFPIQFFVGGNNSDQYRKLQLNPNNFHELTGSLNISNSLIVNNDITASNIRALNDISVKTLHVEIISSSVEYSSGSNIFGSVLTNTHQFTGSVSITGSLSVNDSDVILTNQTSSMSVATSSYALNSNTASYTLTAISSSYALTSSRAINANLAQNASTASYVTLAQTASYVLNAISASYAATASSADTFIVRNDLSGSNAFFTGDITAQTLHVQTVTSSVVYSSGSNIFGQQLSNTHEFTGSVSITGSLSVNNSNVILTNQTSSMSVATASYVLNAISSSFASTASYIAASGVTGLVLSQIATGSVTASVNVNGDTFSLISGSSTLLYISSSGNVGLGTSTPNYRLDINGDINFPTTTGSTYGVIRQNGNTVFHTYGTNNFFIGQDAGNFTTTGTGNNLGIGLNVLKNNTTGNYNIGAGIYSLEGNTAGSNNTAYGAWSLRYNQTSNSNVAIGPYTLANLTSNGGFPNVAIGNSAMYSSTTANGNVAIGNAAMYTNSTGYYNVAIGYWSLRWNTTGYENLGIGLTSLSGNTTGYQNTGIGRSTLRSNQTGFTNTAIGYQAGYSTTGSGNIFIGAQAGYNEVGSNTLYIENSNSTNPLIYGDFQSDLVKINGKLGVNILPSNYNFDVSGSTRISDNLAVSSSLNVTNTLIVTGSQTFISSSNLTPLTVFEPTFNKTILYLSGSANAAGPYYQLNLKGKDNSDVILDTTNGISGSILLGYNSGYARISGDGLLKSKTNTGWQIENEVSGDLPVYVQRTSGGGNGQLFAVRQFSNSTNILTVGTAGVIIDRPSNGLTVTGSLYFPSLSGTNQTNVVGYDVSTGKLYYQTTSSLSVSDAVSASQAQNANTASYVTLAQTASYVLNAVSSSFSTSASQAQNANTASYVTLAQTASYVLNAISASYAATASSADTFIVRNDLSGSNAFFTGNITAQTLYVQTVSSSVEYSSGSNIFGSDLLNTHQFTGSVSMTGSLSVNGSNVVLTNQTGSMSVATASYVLNAVSSSFSTSSSQSQNSNTASFVLNAQTASFVTLAQTASYVLNAQTASYVTLAQTASYVLNAQTASYVTLAQTASYVLNAQTSSFVTLAQTASYVLNAVSSSFSTSSSQSLNSNTASYVLNAVSSSFSTSSSQSQNSNTASFVILAQTASYVLNAETASYVTLAQTASYILNAVSSSFAPNIYNSNGTLTGNRILNLNNNSLTISGSSSGSSSIFFPNGNMGIGTTTDNGYKFEINSIGGNVARIIMRSSIGGGQAITFTQNDVYNTIHSAAHTFISSTNTLNLGAGPGSRTNLGVDRNDALTKVVIGYESWRASEASAMLDIKSTTSGFLMPRMNLTQRTAISTPATGLMVYETGSSLTTEGIWVNESTGWQLLLTNSGSQSISGSITITGSLTATQGITGSLFGTSSWANNSLTSSFITNAQTASYVLNAQTASFVTLAQTASYVLNAISSSYAATASSADTFIVRNDLSGSNARFTGDITAQTLHVQIISSSVEYSSGSNIFGDNLSTTQQFTGSVSITGSLSVAGNVTLYGPAGTDNGNSGSYVTFKNSNNIIGYVTTNQSTDVMTGILGYRSSDGNLIFSEVIDGGTF